MIDREIERGAGVKYKTENYIHHMMVSVRSQSFKPKKEPHSVYFVGLTFIKGEFMVQSIWVYSILRIHLYYLMC